MTALCALCKKTADLQNSHIIPEFFYKLVYDKQPKRFRVMSANPAEPDRFEQKGLREYLLCRDCEQKLNRWETYAKTAFVDGRGIGVVHQADAVVFHKLEYKTFKLFQLSLLWRMSVSTFGLFQCSVPRSTRRKNSPSLAQRRPTPTARVSMLDGCGRGQRSIAHRLDLATVPL